MARRPFGGGVADIVYQPIIGPIGGLLQVGAIEVTFWTAATSGTRITDLLDGEGAPTDVITANTAGYLLPFQGPDDDTFEMWADAGGANRVRIDASDLATAIITIIDGGGP